MTTVLSNTGPVIALGKLNRLELLAELYGQAQTPRAVYDEAVTQGLRSERPTRVRSGCSGKRKTGPSSTSPLPHWRPTRRR